MRELAARAGLSAAAVYAAEDGRPAGLGTYLRLLDALGLHIEIAVLDRRRRASPTKAEGDIVHSAMAEFEVAHLAAAGIPTGVDEPYQHYQFAGRADVVAWDLDARAMLHIENKTRLPNVQETAGAWNSKRAYLPRALATRLAIPGWRSVTHVMAVLWSAEALHVLRLRSATFRALTGDSPASFDAWWSGSAPDPGTTATLIVLDPWASGRQRVYCRFDEVLRARPRYRGYADAAERSRLREP